MTIPHLTPDFKRIREGLNRGLAQYPMSPMLRDFLAVLNYAEQLRERPAPTAKVPTQRLLTAVGRGFKMRLQTDERASAWWVLVFPDAESVDEVIDAQAELRRAYRARMPV